MAGGETGGSAMASITCFLLKNPDAHWKWKKEVHLAYVSYGYIDVASTTKLEYLLAVLKEGMRIFPTAPQGTPRRSPGMTVESHYVPE
jgi:cytochrome P450